MSGLAHEPAELDTDAIGAVLAAIADADAEVVGRATATWSVLSKSHRDACYKATGVWRALTERHFEHARTIVADDSRGNFYAQCDLLRMYRAGTAKCYHENAKVRAFVLASVRHTAWALEDASTEIQLDWEVALKAVTHQPAVWYKGIHWELKCDRDFMLAAVRKTSEALRWASGELQADREVVLASVGYEGWTMEHASGALQADREVVLAAVGNNGHVLQCECVRPEFRADREVVLAAVRSRGSALKYASEELRADREVVLAAVATPSRKYDQGALQFASEEFHADREVVLEALRHDGAALSNASGELGRARGDPP